MPTSIHSQVQQGIVLKIAERNRLLLKVPKDASILHNAGRNSHGKRGSQLTDAEIGL
jgi:hypothetical protein